MHNVLPIESFTWFSFFYIIFLIKNWCYRNLYFWQNSSVTVLFSLSITSSISHSVILYYSHFILNSKDDCLKAPNTITQYCSSRNACCFHKQGSENGVIYLQTLHPVWWCLMNANKMLLVLELLLLEYFLRKKRTVDF
jgi:hypothetical protein